MEELAIENFTKEDEFKLAYMNVDEYIDCNIGVITTTDTIQTTSNVILQYESEDDIGKDPADIMPSSAEIIVSLKTLKKFLSKHEN